MSKRHKKRTKRYQGEDAAAPVPADPVVHHYEAVDRGNLGQWWFERKKFVWTVTKVVLIILALVWLLVELVQIVT